MKSGVHHLRLGIRVSDKVLDIIVYYILLFETPLCKCGAIRYKYDKNCKQTLVKSLAEIAVQKIVCGYENILLPERRTAPGELKLEWSVVGNTLYNQKQMKLENLTFSM